MERIELLKLGAYCLMRLSLKAQRELLSLTENGQPFSETVLSELNGIKNGKIFIGACGGGLDLPVFMDVLAFCDRSTVNRIITDDKHKELFLKSGESGGYFINANEAIYHTLDMDGTIAWFKNTLGWEGIIEARDEAGNGTYGLIQPYLKTGALNNLSPYIQMQRGEPLKSIVTFMGVWGLDNLRQRVIDNGWTVVTPVEKAEWGASVFILETGDGSKMIFYEPHHWTPDFEVK